jgi:hypothetical protein
MRSTCVHNNQIKTKILLLLVVFMLFCEVGQAQVKKTSQSRSASKSFIEVLKRGLNVEHIPFALKTNTLGDLMAIPNIGAEICVYKNFTVGVSYNNIWLRNKAHTKYYRFEAFEAEVSYYINKQRASFVKGHHVGIYGQMQTWDFTLKKQGYLAERWSFGGGVSYGYTLPIVKNLNVDFEIGLGYLGGKRHQYVPENGLRKWMSSKQFHWVGPTKLEVTLQWVLDFKGWR